MATANLKIVQIPVTKFEEQKNYVLELSREEAIALTTVLARIGGNPQHSPRKFISAIFHALHDAGARHTASNTVDETIKRTGSLYFKDHTLSELYKPFGPNEEISRDLI